MAQADLEINRRTRSVLVRHYIDLGHLSLRSINGTVTIRGALMRIFGNQEEITPTLIDAMYKEIKRIPGIKRIHFYLDNWTNTTGSWVKTGSDKQNLEKSKSAGQTGDQKTYDLDNQ
ncbi:hypothetical protein BVX97_02175 [bacterium E08(2017)]|nr:hypothetical protein BVX97_02175 [bacterium E08(2017)]